MTEAQKQDLIGLALHAAYADGSASAAERAAVDQLTRRFPQPSASLPSLDPEVRARTVRELAGRLGGPDTGLAAYEMAVSICDADAAQSSEEKAFLARLRTGLGLAAAEVERVELEADVLRAAPVAAPPVLPAEVPPAASLPGSGSELDGTILTSSILAGALELLPSSLATMAIIPVQLRLVYQVGKAHGYELDRGHITDLLATVGVGLTSQVVEGFVEKAMRGVLGRLAGGLGRSVAGQAASFGISFATTYALGHLARQYYAGGRRFSAIELRRLYDSLLGPGRDLQAKYLPQIRDQAGRVNLASLPALLQGR